MDKFKKIDREFQLTDNSVNCYGFRLLTEGYQQNLFAKNPIGYYMHERAGGVVLKWEDFRTEGDAVFAKPVVNLSNPRGQQTVDEIENGFLNAASVGHLILLEYSDDPTLKLAGQEGPTVTKWYNRETSVVDIPGNFNSLKLFDAEENPLNLSDFTNKLFTKMKQVFLSAEQLGKLNLKADTADVAAVDVALNDLIAKAEKVEGLTQQLTAANTAKTTAETALSNLKKATVEKEVDSVLETALADKKITVELKAKLKAKYAEDVEGLKDLVASMQAYSPITKQIEDSKKTGAPDLSAMTWKELHDKGLLEQLKASDLPAFKEKFKEEFKKEYNG